MSLQPALMAGRWQIIAPAMVQLNCHLSAEDGLHMAADRLRREFAKRVKVGQ
jgi:hypothetical protein